MSGVRGGAISVAYQLGNARAKGDSGTGQTMVLAARSGRAEGDPPDVNAAAPTQYGRTVGGSAGSTKSGLSYDAFFLRYEQPLYGYLRRMLPSDDIALEIAQETFFRAWQHFDAVGHYERPEAWLYRVATNLAISHLRRKRAFSFSQLFGREAEGDAAEPMGEHELLADPLDMERQSAERDQIARVLQRMPPRQQAALLLRAVYGQSCAEVAQALGISLPNARQTLSRGRERFRRLYEADQQDDTVKTP